MNERTEKTKLHSKYNWINILSYTKLYIYNQNVIDTFI